MSNLSVKKMNLRELDNQEMVSIEGGGWLSRAWGNMVNALQNTYDWLKRRGVKAGTDARDFG